MQIERFLLLAAISFAALVSSALACDECKKKALQPLVLIDGLGEHSHPVSTQHPLAQQYFDQGMKLIYAFNHEAAIRSFRRAAELDPKLAMAQWGIAYSLGPNINLEVDRAQEKLAFDAAQEALKLAEGATEHERAYIEALVKRYSDDPAADLKAHRVAFAEAMGKLAERYPDDLDAATLAAESRMNLRPWQLWSREGEPAEGTEQIVAMLESVLARDPRHLGANHYYIHAVEASRTPERALPSADRLGKLAPMAGHLVHMPTHIYIRTGDYDRAAANNEAAIAADLAMFKLAGATPVYSGMYYSHNWHFLSVARALQGRYQPAIEAANQLVKHVSPHVKEMPMLEVFMPTPIYIQVRFQRWDDLLQMPEPDAALKTTQAIWRYARGAALAAQGKSAEAESELAALDAVGKEAELKLIWGLNTPGPVIEIARGHLQARIALARGNREQAIKVLRATAEIEDSLNYAEPPDWYLPAREILGAALLDANQPAAAEEAFRTQLKRHSQCGRALFGLIESLKAQDKTASLSWLQAQQKSAWQHADNPLELRDLQ